MTGIIEKLKETAKANPKRVLLPEQHDERVLAAAELLQSQGLAEPILLTAGERDLPGVEVFDQRDDADQWRARAVDALVEARKAKGMTAEKAQAALENPLLLGAVLLKLGYADAGVAGSIATTADVLRAGIQGTGVAKGAKLVSSFFLMELTDGKVLSYADCAVLPDPDAGQLAEIAICSAASFKRLAGIEPRVAMLSFSTKGSAEHAAVDEVREAVAIAQQQVPDLLLDGEMQFDAAFVPSIGQRKAPDSPVAGQANIYVFPNLDAGNIAYKITQRIGGAKAIGPILQGLAKPWMDLSRGCSSQDIADVAVIAVNLAD